LLLAASASLLGAPLVQAAAVDPVQSSAPSLEQVALLVSGLDFGRLVQEFGLRAPQFEVILFGSNPADQELPVVTVWLLDEGGAAATVELEDGRVYRRELVIDDEDPELGVASELALFLTAIRENTVAPTEIKEVPVDPPKPMPSEEQVETEAPTPVTPEPEPPRPEGPSWLIELQPFGAVNLSGQGSPSDLWSGGVGLLAGGGQRGAWFAGFAVDYEGASLGSASLHRIALGAGGGYWGRWSGFELRVLCSLFVEPWVLTSKREFEVRQDGEVTGGRVGLGAGFRVAPTWRFGRDHAGPALELGPRIGLRAVGSANDGLGAIELRNGDVSRVLGGVEARLGLGIALHLPRGARGPMRGR
jgi:hypothetical protein